MSINQIINLKKKESKNRDYTAYERLKFNEKANELKKELSNLHEEVSNMEINKESINKEITKLNKDKTDIIDEIDKKKTIAYHYNELNPKSWTVYKQFLIRGL